MKTKLKVNEQYVHVLPMNTECIVQGVKVTLLDANQWVYLLTNECLKPITFLFCWPYFFTYVTFGLFIQNNKTLITITVPPPQLSWGSHVAICAARWPEGTPHRWLPGWSIHGALPRAAGSQDTDPLSRHNVSSPLTKLLFCSACVSLLTTFDHINWDGY